MPSSKRYLPLVLFMSGITAFWDPIQYHVQAHAIVPAQLNVLPDPSLRPPICPPIPTVSVPCHVLCVKDISHCPIKPVCPPGSVWCKDGKCHRDNCRTVKTTKCECRDEGSPALNVEEDENDDDEDESNPRNVGEGFIADYKPNDYFPCPIFNGTIEVLDPDDVFSNNVTGTIKRKYEQKLAKMVCGEIAGVKFVPEAKDPEKLFVDCAWLAEKGVSWKMKLRQVREFTYTEPYFIAFYSLMGSVLVFSILFHTYKTYKEKPLRAQELSAEQAEAEGIKYSIQFNRRRSSTQIVPPTILAQSYENVSMRNQFYKIDPLTGKPADPSNVNVLTGFRDSIFGTTLYCTVVIVSFIWPVILMILIGDYYNVFMNFGTQQTLLFLNSTTRSKIFIIVWNFALAWFVVLKVFGKRLRNYFRIETCLSEATFMQIEYKRRPDSPIMDESILVRFVDQLDRYWSKLLHVNVATFTVPIRTSNNGWRYFEFQSTRYIYDTGVGVFTPSKYVAGNNNGDIHAKSLGHSSEEVLRLQELYGKNRVTFKPDSLLWSLLKEYGGWFSLYQFMTLSTWWQFNFWYIAFAFGVIILVSSFIKVYMRHQTHQKVLQLLDSSDSLYTVLRDGKWVEISSVELVPGDVIAIQAQHKHRMACDAVIVSCTTIVVDESDLTGEPTPVRKTQLPNDDRPFINNAAKGHMLFSGTTVIQAIPAMGKQRVIAIVIATSSATNKGSALHNVIFPRSLSFVFNTHLKVAMLILTLWSAFGFLLSIFIKFEDGEHLANWFFGILLLSDILSPLLLCWLENVKSVIVARLNRKNIACLDASRIPIAGKIKYFCFDKTGTLTRRGLEFCGALGVSETRGASMLEKMYSKYSDFPELLQIAMGSCHSITKVNDNIVGDPVDLEMFRITEWELICSFETIGANSVFDELVPPYRSVVVGTMPRLPLSRFYVIKRFEFRSVYQSMSVVVQNAYSDRFFVFAKASYTKIKRMCRPESIPVNYDQMAESYAKKGGYVIGLAYKELSPHMTIEDFDNWQREDAESDMEFLGFLLFRNNLRKDATETITKLKEGDIRPVVITGDNPYTAVCIARQCGIIEDPSVPVFVGDFDERTQSVNWKNIEDDANIPILDSILSSNKAKHPHTKPFELAITGDAFNFLLEKHKIEKYLPHLRVFGRMTPLLKSQCVQLFMEKGVTAMIGDGGNDFAALKAAHVGIALCHDEDPSIAAAFSSIKKSLLDCVEVVREGRAALATLTSMYKYLALIGEISLINRIVLRIYDVNLSFMTWILLKTLSCLLAPIALIMAKPTPKLSPQRPTARLIGPETVISIMFQVVVHILFTAVIIVYMWSFDFFLCNRFNSDPMNVSHWWELSDNYEALVIGFIQFAQVISAAVIYNFGHQYRQTWFKNISFDVVIAFIALIVGALYASGPNELTCWFRINCGESKVLEKDFAEMSPKGHVDEYLNLSGHNVTPLSFRHGLLVIGAANLLVSVLVEYFGLHGRIRSWGHGVYARFMLRRRERDQQGGDEPMRELMTDGGSKRSSKMISIDFFKSDPKRTLV